MTLKELYENFDKYVTVDRFSPVEKIAYGLISLIVSAVIIAGLAFIIK